MSKECKSRSRVKPGRPSSFDPKFCGELIKHCSKGMSFESFAFKIGVSSRTLNNWCRYYGEFAEAHEQAKIARLYFFEQQLNKAITGSFKGNIAALLYALKTQYPEQYSQRRELDIAVTAKQSSTPVTMTPLGPLSELTGDRLEEALKLAQAETEKLEKQIKDIEQSPNPFL